MPFPVQHMIVLMLENRSFDHMLGYLDHPNPAYAGLSGTESNRVDAQTPPTVVSRTAHPVLPKGPGHRHSDVMYQLLNAPPRSHTAPGQPYELNNAGFAHNYQQQRGDGGDIMRCFDPSMVPVLSTLALEYAVCDHWFCSVPGETFPNRHFAHAGTSQGAVDIRDNVVFTGRTLYDQLTENRRPWRVYHDGIPHLWSYPQLWNQGNRNRFMPLRRLRRHIVRDELPAYAFVEPNHWFGPDGRGSSQHPGGNLHGPDDFLNGEQLIADIYGWLLENPAVWEKTLFVITYDEHGGFYDHVTPPRVTPPDREYHQNGDYQFQFDLAGPRVPAVLVSPWIPRHTLDSSVYDHTSLLKSARELFMPGTAPLSAREAEARSFLHNLSLQEPRTDAPSLTPLRKGTLGAAAGRVNAAARAAAGEQEERSATRSALLSLGSAVHTSLQGPAPESVDWTQAVSLGLDSRRDQAEYSATIAMDVRRSVGVPEYEDEDAPAASPGQP